MMNCSPETGACELPSTAPAPAAGAVRQQLRATLHYVGDPMCSWCWGLSSELKQIALHCQQQGIGFSVTMGGLRAGGGDVWDGVFKGFLRREWRHIAAVTGQPFGYGLLDKPYFDYDTEPACRAVAVAQLLLANKDEDQPSALAFFTAVQQQFYVEGSDPKTVDFYRSVCANAGIAFDDFRVLFESDAGKQAAQAHFDQCRAMGVRAFPTLLVEREGELFAIASGYVKAADAIDRITTILAPGR